MIVFDPSITLIPVRGSELLITNNGSLTIEGTGANVLTLSAIMSGININNYVSANRIFRTDNANVTIRNVKLLGGRETLICEPTCNQSPCPGGIGGGAMLVTGGSLLLDGVFITGAKTYARGGAIAIYSSLFAGDANNFRIINSTIFQNQVKAPAGEGAGIYTLNQSNGVPHLFIVNSTISNNTIQTTGYGETTSVFIFSGNGAGIYNGGFVTDIRNSTIVNNSITQIIPPFISGNSILFNNFGYDINNAIGGNQVKVANSIVGSNFAAPANFPSNAPSGNFVNITSLGNNFVKGTSINTTWLASDIVNTVGTINPVTNNGGPTPTVTVTSSSILNAGNNALAIDPFDNSPLLRDQRGTARIFGGTVDIGSLETYGSITVASTAPYRAASTSSA